MKKIKLMLWMQLLILPLLVFSSFSGCEKDDDNRKEDYVSIFPKVEVVFEWIESSDTLIVSSNDTWQVNNVPEWLTVLPISGENGDTLIISVQENPSSSSRSVVLSVQCGASEAPVSVTQHGRLETDYVDLRLGEPGVSISYSTSGDMSVSYADGRIPSVSEYQSIVLPAEYDHDIRVIESVTINGNTLNMRTSQGNMCNLFRNIKFTLSTDPSAPTRSADGSFVYTPVSYGTIDAQGQYTELYNRHSATRTTYYNGDTLWSFHKDFDNMCISSSKAGELYWERLSFDASLQGEFSFDFDEKQISEVRSRGDIKYFSYCLTGNMQADMKLCYEYNNVYKQEENEIINENLLPTRVFKFMVGMVPIIINVDTKLGKYTLFEVKGSAFAETGVKMGNSFTFGAEWTPQDGVQPIGPEAKPTFEAHSPLFVAEASLTGKVSYYPRIEIELYKFIGPWAEPRPYLKSGIEAGKQSAIDGNNYVGWKANLNNGFDLRMGLGLDFFGIEKELYESPMFNPVPDNLIFEAPSRIQCLSPNDSIVDVEDGETIEAVFLVESFSPVTEQYYPCPFALVKFNAECGDLSNQFAIANMDGTVSVEWIPFPDEKSSSIELKNGKLIAHIVNKDGQSLYESNLMVRNKKESGESDSDETVSSNPIPNDSILNDNESVPNESIPNDSILSEIILCPDNNHPHAIDLGLPSGTKYACCNVGASSPEEYGGYYSWGETEEKEHYNWSSYKFGNMNALTKYNFNSERGNVDEKGCLDLSDDVAHVKWGGSWRMPTNIELGQICYSCTWKWYSHNGVNGQLIIGPNGNSIFLPAAGRKYDSYYPVSVGRQASYWSSEITFFDNNYAMRLCFEKGSYYVKPLGYGDSRYYGNSVRPVKE